jgi:hypothetical protein
MDTIIQKTVKNHTHFRVLLLYETGASHTHTHTRRHGLSREE